MKARIILLPGILTLVSTTVLCQPVQKWLTSGPLPVQVPGFVDGPSIGGGEFSGKHILSNPSIDLVGLTPKAGEILSWRQVTRTVWEEVTSPEGEFITLIPVSGNPHQVAYNAFYIESHGLYDYKFEVESPQMFEIFLDGRKSAASYKIEEDNVFPSKTATLELDRGKHLVIVKSLYSEGDENDWMLKATFTSGDLPEPGISLAPDRGMDIHDLLEGAKLSSIRISPDGNLVMVSYRRMNSETAPSSPKRWSPFSTLMSEAV